MKALLLYTLLLAQVVCQAQNAHAQLPADIARMEAAGQEAAALEKLSGVLRSQPNDYYALCKSSELCSRVGNMQKSKSSKLAYFTNGQQYAERAIKLRPAEAEGYYVMAVAMGRMALAAPSKEKIAAVKAIKTNAEKALRFNPVHGRAWHVLGKWHYEVSTLNFVERAAVKVFYGGFPAASIGQAIKAYERAQQLEPGFALNYLELAKAYIEADEEGKARTLLQKLQTLPNKTGEDVRIKAEGKALLEDL